MYEALGAHARTVVLAAYSQTNVESFDKLNAMKSALSSEFTKAIPILHNQISGKYNNLKNPSYLIVDSISLDKAYSPSSVLAAIRESVPVSQIEFIYCTRK